MGRSAVPLGLWRGGGRPWSVGLGRGEALGGRVAGLWTLSQGESLSDVWLVFTPSEWAWAAAWDGLRRFLVGLTQYCRGIGPVCGGQEEKGREFFCCTIKSHVRSKSHFGNRNSARRCTHSSPFVEVGDVHQGVVVLQRFISIQDLNLRRGKTS